VGKLGRLFRRLLAAGYSVCLYTFSATPELDPAARV
jgi:hypothetical protein